MNWVDLLVLVVIGLSALFGFVRGLVREVLGIGAWIGAAALAWLAYPWAAQETHRLIGKPMVADGVAIAVVFIVCLIALSLIAAWIGGVIRHSALGGLDRMLGLIFGLARGAVLILIAYIVLGLIEQPAAWPPAVLKARALPYAYDGAVWVEQLLPPHVLKKVVPPPSPTTTAKSGTEPPAASPDPAKP